MDWPYDMCDLSDNESCCNRPIRIAIPAVAFASITLNPDMAWWYSNGRDGKRVSRSNHVTLETDDPLNRYKLGIPGAPSVVATSKGMKSAHRKFSVVPLNYTISKKESKKDEKEGVIIVCIIQAAD